MFLIYFKLCFRDFYRKKSEFLISPPLLDGMKFPPSYKKKIICLKVVLEHAKWLIYILNSTTQLLNYGKKPVNIVP